MRLSNPATTSVFLALGIAFVPVAAQEASPPIPSTEVKLRKEIYRDPHLIAYLLEIPPHNATVMHRHDTDVLGVFVSGGSTRAVINGEAPKTDNLGPGAVRFRNAGFTHSTENIDTQPFRAVVIEFATAQGEPTPSADPPAHSCTGARQTACTDTRRLLCTAKFCVDDISVDPAGVVKHPDGSQWMLVAVSDYNLAEVGTGDRTVRTGKSGNLEHLAADATHLLKNSGSTPTRFIAVEFR